MFQLVHARTGKRLYLCISGGIVKNVLGFTQARNTHIQTRNVWFFDSQIDNFDNNFLFVKCFQDKYSFSSTGTTINTRMQVDDMQKRIK